jgi:hypothetical protein
MNKRFFVIVFTVLQIACTHNRIPKPHWKLRTEDTEITIAIINHRPAICELKNTKNRWNWMKEFSEMPFPEKILSNGKSCSPDWKYKSAEIEETNGTKLTIHFFSKTPDLELESVWEAKTGGGPVTNQVTILNRTGGRIIFSYADIVSADIAVKADKSVVLWRFTRSKLIPFSVYPGEPDALKGVLTYVFSSNSSFAANITNEVDNSLPTSHPRLPFEMYHIDSENSHGLYFGYEWPFGRFMDMTHNDPHAISHRVYLGDTGSVAIEKEKLLRIPAWYVGAYTGDVDDGSNRMKRWFWDNKITKTIRENRNEPLIEYCVPGNEKELKEYFEKYHVANWGGELAKIDIEWLDGCPLDNNWPKGDFKKYSFWNPSKEKWPSGMTAGNIVHQNNQRLSLYMCNTFEDCYIGTQEGREKEKAALLWRYDNYHYDYWRSDFFLENNPFDYLSHEGLLEILDYMIAKRPGFRYEHCSGAAALKDFSTLQRINVFTSEDSADPLNHRIAFYTNSYMINPVQIKADVGLGIGIGDCNNRACCDYCFRTGFLGANMATAGYTYTAVAEESAKVHWALYAEKQRPILRKGDVYHILPIPDGINWDGIEFFNTALNKGSVILFKPSDTAPESKAIVLKGLNRQETYTISFQDRKDQNRKMTGAELMDQGIPVKGMTGACASEIIWIN